MSACQHLGRIGVIANPCAGAGPDALQGILARLLPALRERDVVLVADTFEAAAADACGLDCRKVRGPVGDACGLTRELLEAGVDTVMAREAVSESVARRRMHEMDANRAAYLRQAYGLDRRDPVLYTLQCNTGLLGYARTVEIILAAAGGLAEARAAGAALAHESSR